MKGDSSVREKNRAENNRFKHLGEDNHWCNILEVTTVQREMSFDIFSSYSNLTEITLSKSPPLPSHNEFLTLSPIGPSNIDLKFRPRSHL